jgi:hypothetical protein
MRVVWQHDSKAVERVPDEAGAHFRYVFWTVLSSFEQGPSALSVEQHSEALE